MIMRKRRKTQITTYGSKTKSATRACTAILRHPMILCNTPIITLKKVIREHVEKHYASKYDLGERDTFLERHRASSTLENRGTHRPRHASAPRLSRSPLHSQCGWPCRPAPSPGWVQPEGLREPPLATEGGLTVPHTREPLTAGSADVVKQAEADDQKNLPHKKSCLQPRPRLEDYPHLLIGRETELPRGANRSVLQSGKIRSLNDHVLSTYYG